MKRHALIAGILLITSLVAESAQAQQPWIWQQGRDCRPDFYATVDALFLFRDESDGRTLATLNTPFALSGRPAVLASEDLGFDASEGLRIAIGVPLDDGTTLEGVYFFQDEWNGDGQTLSRAPGPGSALNSNFTLIQNFGTSIRVDGESELHNGELNLLHDVTNACSPIQATLVTGLRYVNFRDRVGLSLDSSVPAAPTIPATPGAVQPGVGAYERTEAETKNANFGLQLGGIVDFNMDPVTLSASLKGLLLVNWYESNATNILNDPSGTFLPGQTFRKRSDRDDEVDVTVGVDASLSARLWLTSNLSLRVGYQLMALSNQAVASEHLPRVAQLPLVGADIRNRQTKTGPILFHGPSAGIELAW